MKPPSSNLMAMALIGAGVAVGAALMPLDPGARLSALVGTAAATLVGGYVLMMKTRGPRGGGTGGLKTLLSRHVAALLLRLGTVGLGAGLVHVATQLPPSGFVIAFLVTYLAQQVIEMRSLLSLDGHAKNSEVST